MPCSPRPLDGLRILDTATFIAGPYSAGLLAEFGAEVIKIEQPGDGDPMRRFGTMTACGDTLAWLSEARNKKSVTLDLRAAEGAALFRDLVTKSDVVIENFPSRHSGALGLGLGRAAGPESPVGDAAGVRLRSDRPLPRPPRLCPYCPCGRGAVLSGRNAGRGFRSRRGQPLWGDYISGLYGVVGILLALRHRDQSGQGQYIDVALFESVFRMLDELAPAYAHTGKIRDREGSGTLNACPHGHFQCADGEWLAIACTNDKMFCPPVRSYAAARSGQPFCPRQRPPAGPPDRRRRNGSLGPQPATGKHSGAMPASRSALRADQLNRRYFL